MEKLPALFRRRYFPNELIYLKDDVILVHTPKLIVTQWNTLKPRADISHGISAYFLESGYKVSKIYNNANELVYWYCDIIETEFKAVDNSYIFHDLLIDIIILPDGQIRVVDLDELGDLLTESAITSDFCSKALKQADLLLKIIYSGRFHTLQKVIEELE